MNRPALAIPPELAATLVLVRHGESTFVAEGRFQGRQDPPLSELGGRQAELVAQRLAEQGGGNPLPVPFGPPLAVFHSPLSRAAQTARLIAESQPAGVDLIASEGLTELAQGEWEGLLHREVRARWPRELARWRREPTRAHAPGGESLPDAAKRVAGAIEQILDMLMASNERAETDQLAPLERTPVPGYPPAPGMLTQSADPWAVLVAHDGIFRLILMTLLQLPYERFWAFPFNLCAISVISLSEGVAALRAHNLAEHLAPLAAEQAAAEEMRGDRRGAL